MREAAKLTLPSAGLVGAVLAWLPADLAIAWIATFAAVSAVLVLLIGRPPGSVRFTYPIVLLVVGLALGCARAPDRSEALILFRGYVAVILIYYICVLSRSRWITTLLLTGLITGSLIAAAFVIYLWAGDPYQPKITALNQWLYMDVREWLAPRWTTRVEPSNLNAAGFLLATLVPLPFVRALRAQRATQMISWLIPTIALLAWIGVMSGRSSWFGALIGLLVASLVVGRGTLIVASAMGTGVLTGLALGIADPRISSPDSLAERVELWRRSLDILSTNLPLGLGVGAFPHVLAEALGNLRPQIVPSTPHNSWLQLAGDAGILGLLAFAVGFVIFVNGLRGIRRGGAARQAAVSAIFTYGSIGIFESLVVFTQPLAPGIFLSVASPIPWVLLAVAERERTAQIGADAGGLS